MLRVEKYNLSKVGDDISRLMNCHNAIDADLKFGCENFSSETNSILLPVAQEHASCASESLFCISEVTKNCAAIFSNSGSMILNRFYIFTTSPVLLSKL